MAALAELNEESDAGSSVWDKVRSSVRRGLTAYGPSISFHALGARCRLIYGQELDPRGEGFIAQAIPWIAAFESKYSHRVEGSLVSRINQTAGSGWVSLDEDAERLISLCSDLVFLTGGAFDPSLQPVSQYWRMARRGMQMPVGEGLETARSRVGWSRVQKCAGGILVPESMGIDLDPILRGYAVDRLVQLAQRHGVESLMVDFGDQVRCVGHPRGHAAWEVFREVPGEPEQIWVALAARNFAMAATTGTIRFLDSGAEWREPVLNPWTGLPVQNSCRDILVLASNCTIGSALATAISVLGDEAGLALVERFYSADCAILTPDGRRQTGNFHTYEPPTRQSGEEDQAIRMVNPPSMVNVSPVM